jgi:hypothetical protein
MLAAKKSAGGSRHELFAIKTVVKEDVSEEDCMYYTLVEKQAFIHAIGHPFLLQLHSCFQSKVRAVSSDTY